MGDQDPRGFAAASTASVTGARMEGMSRDRGHAPGYDGENPEATFRQYEKQVALWEFEAEVAKAKRGVKLLRQLSGVAALAVDDLRVEDIACKNGVKNVLNRLREYFLPHLEVSLPRAFEAAVYGAPRGQKESFAEYTKRMERAFLNLATEGPVATMSRKRMTTRTGSTRTRTSSTWRTAIWMRSWTSRTS